MGFPNLPLIDTPGLAPVSHWHTEHSHAVQFYSDDDFLIGTLADFLFPVLQSGEAAVVFGTQSHLDGLSSRLNAQGVDVFGITATGRLILQDAAAVLRELKDGGTVDTAKLPQIAGPAIDRARAAAKGSSDRVVVFGEIVALLCEEGNYVAALELEEAWNELSKSHSFSLHCAYPLAAFSREEQGEMFLKVCGVHAVVLPTEGYTALPEEGERLRTITRLQQQAAALENEVIQHQEARSRNYDLMAEVRKRELVEDRLRTLTGRLLSIRDEERRRVARELHESTAQRLTALSMNMCILQEVSKGRSAETNEIVEQCNSLVKGLLDEVRTLSHMLHPPLLEEVGLHSALLWYAHRFAERSQIKVSLQIPPNLGRLSRETEIAVFRIVQEALANVHRHSGSKTALVAFKRDEQRLSVLVEDAGNGITPEKQAELASGLAGNFGIYGMRERLRQLGGTLEVKSVGAGTLLLAMLPITAQSSTLSSPESILVD